VGQFDADSKLLISWLVGGRDTGSAMYFMDDLRSRLANRVQLTSDGHRPYLTAVDSVFGGGHFVRITMPSREAKTVYGFATEADAARWIRQESQAWLYERKAPRAKLAN
jgi:hypothetical protein